jgi:hypothetical protein
MKYQVGQLSLGDQTITIISERGRSPKKLLIVGSVFDAVQVDTEGPVLRF